MECRYCHKICKNSNSLRNHERLCNNNPNRQFLPAKSDVWYESLKQRKPSNQYIKAKTLGQPKPQLSVEQRQRISDRVKIQNSVQWTDERRQKHSAIMKAAVLKHPESYSSSNIRGRVKIYVYNGNTFHGKWELAVVKWLDDIGVNWSRNVDVSFKYYWDNKWHLYFPDIYLPDLDAYIEVKGFKTERDEFKWKYFTKKLFIIDKDVIKILSSININNLKSYCHGALV